MAYNKYTDLDRIKALELLAMGHTLSDVHRTLGIPISTIKGWRDEKTLGAKAVIKELDTSELAGVRKLKKQEFVNCAWNIIGMANKLLSRRLTRSVEQEDAIDALLALAEEEILSIEGITPSEINSKMKKIHMQIAELRLEDITKLSTTLGTLYDKQALASNEATQNINATVSIESMIDKVKGEEY